MQLISLNTWGGKCFKELRDFISDNRKETDIFCFQEVFSTSSEIKERNGFRMNLFRDFQEMLPDFQGQFDGDINDRSLDGPVHFPLSFGLATFINKHIEVIERGTAPSYIVEDEPVKLQTARPRIFQYSVIRRDDTELFILNVHGTRIEATNKKDTPGRIKQSQRLLEFVNGRRQKGIICGDFNLLPNTESIHLIEKKLDNLIKRYAITSTRSELYPKPIRFADFTFVTPGVDVRNFRVPDVIISDHLPMILEFK